LTWSNVQFLNSNNYGEGICFIETSNGQSEYKFASKSASSCGSTQTVLKMYACSTNCASCDVSSTTSATSSLTVTWASAQYSTWKAGAPNGEASTCSYLTTQSDGQTMSVYGRAQSGVPFDICQSYSELSVATFGTYSFKLSNVCSAGTSPTGQPTSEPSASPTGQPSSVPSIAPSSQPTGQPSSQPTARPSRNITGPTWCPTSTPSTQPSASPTALPTMPTLRPSLRPASAVTNDDSGCSPGSFASNGVCHLCPMGKFQPYPKGSDCLNCPAGTESLHSGASAATCRGCPPGTYSPAGSSMCSPCPAGSFSYYSSASCITCLPGKFAPRGQSMCYDCVAGTYSARGAESCTACPNGQFSAPGAGQCDLCSS
jgi:syndecan 4